MVYQTIKVYARLRKEFKEKSMVAYEVTKKKKEYEDLMFYPGSRCLLNSTSGFRKSVPGLLIIFIWYSVQYRMKSLCCEYEKYIQCGSFYKVFNINTHQTDIFDTVAIPVINSVIEGFNGTIFAYGQTGSGKTYSITGSSNNYNERGIIPRSIQYIFEHYENVAEKPTVYISYMEIYNEVGYDLLSTKQSKVSRILEELPRVTLLEDKKGDAHIRNLNVFPVTTEQEAMRLLFLGDTNRTIAETVSNEFSSRSHCIFTLYINLRDVNSANLRSSKLHLVDLAGSERISKTHSKGTCLQEAKAINLSLHFLQQVILALSESNRTHIPYRNSMLTHILKDSLNGNCITSMLATLSTLKSNIEESISTCRFAQKVSLITTDPVINVLDPQREIAFLKIKVEDLEKRLSIATGFTSHKCLNKQKMEGYLTEVMSFLGSDKEKITVEPDMTEIQYCFGLLKSEVKNKKKECADLETSLMKQTAEISMLNEELSKKNKEIVQLRNLIDRIPERPVPLNSFEQKLHPVSPLAVHTDSSNEKQKYNSVDEAQLYEMFMSSPEISRSLNFFKKALENKFNKAKVYAETIENCQKYINEIRRKLDTPLSWTERNRLLPELEEQQAIYKKAIMELKCIQNETVHLQCGLKQAEVKYQHRFEIWVQEYYNGKNACTSFDSDQRKIFNDKFHYKTLLDDEFIQKQVHEPEKIKDRSSFDDHNFLEKLKYSGEETEQQLKSGCDMFAESLPCNNVEYYFRSPCSYEPISLINYIPSSTSIREDSNANVTGKYLSSFPQTKGELPLEKHSRCSTQCIHCCQQFQSDSTVPQSVPSYVDFSTMTNNYKTNYATDSACSEEKVQSLGTVIGTMPGDLVATKDSDCTINTYDNADNILEDLVSNELNFPVNTLKSEECISVEDLTYIDKSTSRISHLGNEDQVLKENKSDIQIAEKESDLQIFLLETDTAEFKEFMKSVTLTGLAEIDEEIFSFYRGKFC